MYLMRIRSCAANVFIAIGLSSAFAGASPAQTPQSTQPATTAAGDDAVRVNRLLALAAQLADDREEAVPLLTDAARLCGFVIWTEGRKPIAQPLGSPRLGLALTDAEIRDYCLMYRTGHRVRMGDFIAGLDVLYHLIVPKGSLEPHIADWLRTGQAADNPSVRALTAFIVALTRNHDRAQDVTFDADTLLDPIQALLIVRVVTEDMGVPYRRALNKKLSRSPSRPRFVLAAYAPQAAETELPGWAEDAFTFVITKLNGEVMNELARRGAPLVEDLAKGASKVNAIATIAKFITTYTFLKGEMRVEDPGQPLVRTKDTTAGEQRTLVAKFFIDGTRVADWMKEHRLLAATAGLDLDMPKTGALKGIETGWEFGQSRKYYTKQLIHFVGDDPQHPGQKRNMDRIKTDENGEARLTVEGNPQPYDLDKAKVRPVEKSVRISVTPQAKGTEIKQDMVDAVTGAIGVAEGGIGWLVPVIECLYRMKWFGTISMPLQVRDWQPIEIYGRLSIEIHERGTEFKKAFAIVETIDRTLTVTDMILNAQVNGPAPSLPKDFDRMTPERQKLVLEANEVHRKMADRQSFRATGPGSVFLSINDSSLHRREVRGTCDPGTATQTMTSSTIGSANFEYAGYKSIKYPLTFDWSGEADPQTKKATLRIRAGCGVKNVKTIQSGKAPGQTETRDWIWDILGLKLLVDTSKGIEIPLQETTVPGDENASFYGLTKLPFTFGPDDRFKGDVHINFSVTRKLPTKGG